MQEEHRRSEYLLSNILPGSVAKSLKKNPNLLIADSHKDIVILFADIVGFTKRVSVEPADVSKQKLDGLFRDLDNLAETNQLEKIKTNR